MAKVVVENDKGQRVTLELEGLDAKQAEAYLATPEGMEAVEAQLKQSSSAPPVEQPSYEGTEFEGVAPYEMEAIQATRQRAEAQKQEENKTLFDRAMDFMVPEQAQQFMTEWGKQATDPYGRLQERRTEARQQGDVLNVPFRERIQNVFSGHLSATEESKSSQPFEELPELQGLNSATMKALAGYTFGSSNEELAKAISKDENFKDVTHWTDDGGNIIFKSPHSEETYTLDKGASQADVLGLVSEMMVTAVGGRILKGIGGNLKFVNKLTDFLGGKGIVGTSAKAMTEQLAMEELQEVTGSGEVDPSNVAIAGPAQAALRAVGGGIRSLIKTGGAKKLAKASVEGSDEAQTELAKILDEGSEQEVLELQSALANMGLTVRPDGRVVSGDIDLDWALEYAGKATSDVQASTEMLARAFKNNPAMINRLDDEGLLEFVSPAEMIDRGHLRSRQIADAAVDRDKREQGFTQLAKALNEKLRAVGTDDRPMGQVSREISENILGDITTMKNKTDADYKSFYSSMADKHRIDVESLRKEIKKIIADRSQRDKKKGYKWAKGEEPNKATPLEAKILSELRDRKSTKETVPAVTDRLTGRVDKEAVVDVDMVPPSFGDIDTLKRWVGTMIGDPQFKDQHGGYIDQIYGVLKRQTDDAVDQMVTKGDLPSDAHNTWKKLNSDVVMRKDLEDDLITMFGKKMKDLRGFSDRVLGDVSKGGETQFLDGVNTLPKKYRAKFLASAMLHSVSKDIAEKGFKGFGSVWKAIKKDSALSDLLNKELGANEMAAFRNVGEISEAIYESTAKKANLSTADLARTIEGKERIFTRLLQDLQVSMGSSMIAKSIAGVPVVGGQGSLALSLGVLNSVKKFITGGGPDADKAIQILRSPNLKELMASELKDTDFLRFANSNKVRIWFNQIGRAKTRDDIARTVRAWARSDQETIEDRE